MRRPLCFLNIIADQLGDTDNAISGNSSNVFWASEFTDNWVAVIIGGAYYIITETSISSDYMLFRTSPEYTPGESSGKPTEYDLLIKFIPRGPEDY